MFVIKTLNNIVPCDHKRCNISRSVMETSVQIIIVELLDSLFKANFQRRHFTFDPNTELRTICMFIDWIAKGKMGTDVVENSHSLFTITIFFSFSFLNQPRCQSLFPGLGNSSYAKDPKNVPQRSCCVIGVKLACPWKANLVSGRPWNLLVSCLLTRKSF